MAHFAELDSNNVVIRVIVVDNKDCLDENGVEQEHIGAAFCQQLFGGVWKQTSYNRNFRRLYAGPDFIYVADIDEFVPPKPFPSWALIDSVWKPPTPVPEWNSTELVICPYRWDEDSLSWVLV
jgi:hypothetical protein